MMECIKKCQKQKRFSSIQIIQKKKNGEIQMVFEIEIGLEVRLYYVAQRLFKIGFINKTQYIISLIILI